MVVKNVDVISVPFFVVVLFKSTTDWPNSGVPTTGDSKTYHKLAMVVCQHNIKCAMIAEITTEVDPNKDKVCRIVGLRRLGTNRSL